jgi:hypothetical protein
MKNKSPPNNLTVSQHREIVKGDSLPGETEKANRIFQDQMRADGQAFKKGYL